MQKMVVEMHEKWKRESRFLMLLICCRAYVGMFIVYSVEMYRSALLLFLFTAEIFCYQFCVSHSAFMACTMVYVSEDYENMQPEI